MTRNCHYLSHGETRSTSISLLAGFPLNRGDKQSVNRVYTHRERKREKSIPTYTCRVGFIPSSSKNGTDGGRTPCFVRFAVLFFFFFSFFFFFFFFFFFSDFFSFVLLLHFFVSSERSEEGPRRGEEIPAWYFARYRDRIYIGDIILDDVVIRYAGIHDAAFDVNCEERRSRFCFIPRPFLFATGRTTCRYVCRPVSRDTPPGSCSTYVYVVLSKRLIIF